MRTAKFNDKSQSQRVTARKKSNVYSCVLKLSQRSLVELKIQCDPRHLPIPGPRCTLDGLADDIAGHPATVKVTRLRLN